MSVVLYLDLASYEGKDVYQEVLVAHIEDVKRIVKNCESLKKYDGNSTKAISAGIEEPIKSTEGSLFKLVFTKLSVKNNELNFASIKQYIDECNGFDVYEELPSKLYEKLTSKLWDLFALSVCSDHLLWLIQQNELTIEQYVSFFEAVGMQVSNVDHSHYHPFYHEIYYVNDVLKVGEKEQIVIKEQLYPMIMFGDLQFSRAGVIVNDHPCIDKNLAENSDMYFVNRRENRERHDLSDGWGSNSRWRTDFVRNYETANEWKFNVDGKIDLRSEQDYLQDCVEYGGEMLITVKAARELLVNRCFIHQNNIFQEIQSDLFPYDWRLDISRANFNYIRWIEKIKLSNNK